MVTMPAAPPPERIISATTAIAALTGDDNQTRYYAAWWLGKHQIQEAVSFLCQALQDERYRTEQGGYPLRRQAARALGQLKNPQAVPALLAALSCPEDLRLREAVVQALGAIGDRQAIPALIHLLKSDSEQPYEMLIEALGTLQAWEARPLVEPFLQYQSERVQCAAARYLYLLTQETPYIERIIKNLSHENMYLRWAAAFDLGAIGHLVAAEAIINAKVGNSLKLLNLKRILEAALTENETEETAKPEDCQVLLAAIDGLITEKQQLVGEIDWQLENLNNIQLITHLSKSVNPLEVAAIIQILTARKATMAIAPFLEILHHHHPAISNAAVAGLVALAPDSVEPLIAAFETAKDHGLQAYIVQALAQIGDERSLDLLIKIVGVEVANHCQGTIRRVAARGLGKIGSQSQNPAIIQPAIDKLNWALLYAEDWALRYAAALSLGEIGTKAVQTCLQQALAQETDKVVQIRIQTSLVVCQS